MRKIMLAIAMSGIVAAAGPGFSAELKYTSNDVVDFMLKSVAGATRGVCVGTAEECQQAARPKGFDVMVNFDLDSANLTPDAVQNLNQVATALTDPRLSGARFAIEGYTDARGSDAYNLTLSSERAKSVADFLIDHGVSPERLIAEGNGESSPRVPDPLDPINRRVEMRINLE
jgi:outer membrane protein OmpA-like peptidoglycan-associated protein